MDDHMPFMESAFSPGWTNRIKMIMPETQLTVPIDEYIRNINWNALMPITSNGSSKEKTNAFPLNQSRLCNMPHPNNVLRPNSLLNPNQIPIRNLQHPPIISRTNSFPIGSSGVQGRGHSHHNGQQQTQIQQQGQQNHQVNRNGHAGHLGNDKYKTSLCKSFTIHGICKYGTQCLFAHGDHELRKFNQQQNIAAVTRTLNNNAHPHPPHGIYNNNVNAANHQNHNIPPSGHSNNAANNLGHVDLRPSFHHHHQNVGPPPIRPPNMNNNAYPPPHINNGRNNHPSGSGHNKISINKRPAI